MLKIAKLKFIISRITAYLERFFKWLSFNDEDEILSKELKATVQKIQSENYKRLVIENFVSHIKQITLEKDGYLITDVQAFNQAHQLFLNGKNSGKIDLLNSLIPEEEYYNGRF